MSSGATAAAAEEPPSAPPEAHVRLGPASDVPGDAAAGRRLCTACGEPLGNGQRPGARYHGGACRAAGSRARRQQGLLERIDALESDLAALRAEVLRGDRKR